MTAGFAIAAFKGGTGKSTAAACIAAGLGARGLRTLVVDLDPQSTVSEWLGLEPSAALATAMLAGGGVVEPMPTNFAGVHGIAGAVELFGPEHAIIREEIEPAVLGRVLAPVASRFDALILDSHPGLLSLVGAAIEATGRLLVVTDTSGAGLDGAQATADLAEARDAEILGVVVSNFDTRTAWSRELLIAARRVFGDALIEPPLRRSVRLAEAPTMRVSPLEHARGEAVARDIEALASAVASRLGLPLPPATT